jgi:hypothetical protein
MSTGTDFWYIRFPDGRVLRAASTTVVRQELGSGRIPAGSTVRRAPEEEWVAIEWMREFSDLPPGRRPGTHAPAAQVLPRTSTVASRLDSDRMQFVGVRNVLQELQAALDSTLAARKLIVAALAGLVFGILATLVQKEALDFGQPWLNLTALLAAGALVIGIVAGLITKLTYVELSRLRLATWHEGLAGLDALAIRLAVGLGLVAAATWGLIVLLRWLPVWLLPDLDSPGAWLREAIPGAVLAAAMAFEVALWAVLCTASLLAPLLVVEECSIVRGIWQWLALLRAHLGRVFLFEGLAVAIAIVLTLPFAALLIPLWLMYVPERLALAGDCARNLLAGIVGGLFLAYILVANVFIYLHIRYTLRKRK